MFPRPSTPSGAAGGDLGGSYPNPTVLQSQGTFVANGLLKSESGIQTANSIIVNSPSVTSGTAFTPGPNADSMVYVQLNATVAGSYTITIGPSTGAENTVCSSVAMLASSDAVVTVKVPNGWKMVITVSSVTIGSVLAVIG